MKILTWNVNGLRAIKRKGAWDDLLALEADIMCLQEIKSTKDQLTKDQLQPYGYFAFFNSSKVKKGYAGTAIYSKQQPVKVIDDLGEEKFDTEGRLQTAYFNDFILVNCYFPQGAREGRLEFKLEYYDKFLQHVEGLKSETGLPVLFCGDVNTAHHAVDLARPKDNEKNTGFLPEERAWLDQLEDHGWADAWRHYYPNKTDVYTYWDQKTRARDRNVGWRIDYFWANQKALKKISKVDILTDFMGSDHCPVIIETSL